MALKDRVIRSQLIPPQQRRGVVRRPRVEERLMQALDYPLTLVQAGTGYGKSTALAAMALSVPDLFWYTITQPDRDPLLFLAHLICAFERANPAWCQPALSLLEHTGGRVSPETLTPLLNALTQGLQRDTVLVLDDYHWVSDVAEIAALVERLLDYRPPHLRLVISSRQRPKLTGLTRWQAKGQVLNVTRGDLAFTAAEIEKLFTEQYGYPLRAEQAQALLAETEGWAIALQMIWQSLPTGTPPRLDGTQQRAAAELDTVLSMLPATMETLFDYLAQDVLARRPADIQRFLLRTSVLRELQPAACDHLLQWTGSAALLSQLEEEGFFVVRLGDAYRYHHLFHDFLRQQAVKAGYDIQSMHRDAATYFQQHADTAIATASRAAATAPRVLGEVDGTAPRGISGAEEAIYHWLCAHEYATAAEMMVQASTALVRDGRVDTMSEWATALPPTVLERFPTLMYRMGELCRFASRFEEALAWYEQARQRYRAQGDPAGESRALRGQAAVYLDTVRPLRAESLLQEALRLIDGQPDREEQAQLLELMAENMTNRGRSEEAAVLLLRAREVREEGPGRGDLDVRVLLRTGRLEEARVILEERASEERRATGRFREPRAHRESLLVLSLIDALQGLVEEAFATAREGIDLGRRLGSPFVEAVGYMRLGHAWQTSTYPQAAQREQALSCYTRAMEIGERLAVPRTKAEALWGLTRLYGLAGNLPAAEQSAQEGMSLALSAGDEWMAALVSTMLGASYVAAGRQSDAEHWLRRSASAFRDCGDAYGESVALLWRCVPCGPPMSAAAETEQRPEPPVRPLERLLGLAQTHHYDLLLTRKTFLGLLDPPAVIPLLIYARQKGIQADYASSLLRNLRLDAERSFHPGYSLHIHTLGQFVVRRGAEEVASAEWSREKARQLLQVLLTHRGRFLQRDEIAELLWPGADADSGESQFKVTLNALQAVLEPRRPPRAAPLFVQRRGNAYGLNPEAPLWIDAAIFEHLLQQADAAAVASRDPEETDGARALALYRQAVGLFQGDYLPDCLYEDWSRDERERLHKLYLHALTAAAERLQTSGERDEAILLCQQALAADNCLESAYQLLMRAYLAQGNRAEALRTYERCLTCLREELDVQPMPETTSLGEEIRGQLLRPATPGG
jgi:LuxR family maltose regulon positive regulatory protein